MRNSDSLLRDLLHFYGNSIHRGGSMEQLAAQAFAVMRGAGVDGLAWNESFTISEDGWRIVVSQFLPYLSNEQAPELYFWAFDMLLQSLILKNPRWTTFDDSTKAYIKTAIFESYQKFASKAPQYVKSKVAVLLTAIAKLDYPTKWPAFFTDLLSIVEQGPDMIELFLNVLKTVDEEVVNGQLDSADITNFKEAMKVDCIPDIIQTLCRIVQGCVTNSPLLPILELTLDCLQRFVSWVSISLICNDIVVPLVYSIIARAELSGNIKSRAADTLFEVLYKGMDDASKLQIILQIDLLGFLENLLITLPPQAWQDVEFSEYIAGLTALLGNTLLEMGPSSSNHELIGRSLSLAIHFIDHPAYNVVTELMPFFHSYTDKVSKFPVLMNQDVYTRLFNSLLTKLSYPLWYSFEYPHENETVYNEFRQEFRLLFRYQVLKLPDITLGLASQHITNALARLDSISAPDAEAMLRLFAYISESNGALVLLQADSKVICLFRSLMETSLASTTDELVLLAYFDILPKYIEFMVSPEFITRSLMGLTSSQGLCHPSSRVRGRSCYIIMRCIRALEPSSVYSRLDLLKVIADTVATSLDLNPTCTVDIDAIHYLCECLGLLLNSIDDSFAINAYEYVFHKFGHSLSLLAPEMRIGGDPGTILAYIRIVHCFGKILKPLTLKSMSSSKAIVLISQFDVALAPFNGNLEGWGIQAEDPEQESYRDVIVYLSTQLVACLGDAFLPRLLPLFHSLLISTLSTNFEATMNLCAHLVHSYNANQMFVEHLDKEIPTILQRYQLHLGDFPLVESSIALKEKCFKSLEYRRSFFSFLVALVKHKCTHIMLSPTNFDNIRSLLTYMTELGEAVTDLTFIRGCYTVVQKLAEFSISEQCPVDKRQQFVQFVVAEIFPHSLKVLFSPSIVPTDAVSASTVLGIVRLHIVFVPFYGREVIDQIAQLFRNYQTPDEFLQQYEAVLLEKRDTAARKLVLKLLNHRVNL